MRERYSEEKGHLMVKGTDSLSASKMEWIIKRSKGESAFGVKGSRIFEMKILRDGKVTAEYERGWIKKPLTDDEKTALCMSYLLQTYGKEKKREKVKNDA